MGKLNLVIVLLILFSCKQQTENKASFKTLSNNNIITQGRVDFLKDSTIALISPGALVSFNFSGNRCEVNLKGEFLPHNYISFELDGKHLGRIKIESDSLKPYKIEIPNSNEVHTLKIIKESEASNGAVIIGGLNVEKIEPTLVSSKKYIEFIGNSITCGAASDSSVLPCEEGEYFDHQNVYNAYGPRLARALDVDFMLSSVSGIGIYRNWNDENIEEPIMLQVYENLYLNTDASKKYDFSKQPNLVSICLGTNDFSNGDGVKPRSPFNKELFISNYIKLIEMVYRHYPTTQIVLLNSPMISGETNDLFISYLEEIKSYVETNFNKKIPIIQFSNLYVNGCSYHPSVEEHGKMANELAPIFNNLLNN
jgi:lysophospholipase L1-like esterase